MTRKIEQKGLPRTVEVLLALSALIVLSPLLLAVAILIKLTSKGSFLFRQKRTGFNGREFTLYKFRTMRVVSSGPLVTAATDKRITAVGKFLRKTKIDELPQLWNVVSGDMGLVGPRPEATALVDLSNPLWHEILRVRPGLTDPVTLKLRNEEILLAAVEDQAAFYREVLQPYKMNGYVQFLKHKNWKTDIKIIAQTVKTIILPKGVTISRQEELKLPFPNRF